MPVKEFLENYPLYRQYKTDSWMWDKLCNIPKPAIHMYCNSCNSDQTFNMINNYSECGLQPDAQAMGQIVRAVYACSACGKGQKWFLLLFSGEVPKKAAEKSYLYITKVGQHPPWSIKADKSLEKLLGEHADYYKKGLVCESQSYGIGAYAYFRRITEDVIGSLLDSLSELIEPSEKEKYQAALEKAKSTKAADKKIELIQDLLPSSLRPGGMNPLKALYGALSEGLHGKSDEDCMGQAEIIKKVLVYLVNQILRTKEDRKEFTEGMKKLLDG